MRHRHGRPSAAAAVSEHDPGSFLSSFQPNSHPQSLRLPSAEDPCNDRSYCGQQQQQV